MLKEVLVKPAQHHCKRSCRYLQVRGSQHNGRRKLWSRSLYYLSMALAFTVSRLHVGSLIMINHGCESRSKNLSVLMFSVLSTSTTGFWTLSSATVHPFLPISSLLHSGWNNEWYFIETIPLAVDQLPFYLKYTFYSRTHMRGIGANKVSWHNQIQIEVMP